MAGEEELDRTIEAWTSTQDKMVAMHALQQAGVAAGAVMTNAEHFGDPHLDERGFFTEVSHPVVGTYPFPAVNGFRLSKSPPGEMRHAPLFGEHNHYLLHDLLGVTDEEMSQLEAQHIISDRPLADAPRAR